MRTLNFLVWGLIPVLVACNYYEKKSKEEAFEAPGKPPIQSGDPKNPGAGPSAQPQATYQSIYKLVIKPEGDKGACFRCHSGADPAADLDFSTYESLMASGTIVKSSPKESSFYTEIEEGTMPKKAPKLSEEKIKAVHDWIAAGALNN